MEQYCCPFENRHIERVCWAITGKCNFRCRHCGFNTPDAAMSEMTYEEAIRFVDQMADCGVRYLELTGGEPFVREDFWLLVDHIIEKGIKIEKIHTNGWMLMDSILDKFEQYGVKPEFCVGFDGVERHDWLRGLKGAEQAALNALRRCYLRGFPTSVEMCIHRGNVDVLRETVDVLADSGVGRIVCHPIADNNDWNHYAAGNNMSDSEYVEAVLKYIPEYYLDGMRIDVLFEGVVELYKGTVEYRVIYEGDTNGSLNNKCYITPDGKMTTYQQLVCLLQENNLEKVHEVCDEAIRKYCRKHESA